MRDDKTIVPNNETLRYYFYFIQERMEMFWRKIEGNSRCTKDEILRNHKFTNVYRASDRVSQYLIKEVIYKDIEQYKPEDVLLRILVFKVFNKIETWEFLKEMLPCALTVETFDPHFVSVLLTERQKRTAAEIRAIRVRSPTKLRDTDIIVSRSICLTLQATRAACKPTI